MFSSAFFYSGNAFLDTPPFLSVKLRNEALRGKRYNGFSLEVPVYCFAGFKVIMKPTLYGIFVINL